jgi:hypothetical protein
LRAILIVLCLSTVLISQAAANPSVGDWAYISFDPSGDILQNEVTPAPYTTVDSYVVGDFTAYGAGGWETISFRLSNPLADCPGVMATASFVNLLPGNLAVGDWSTGLTIASTECLWGPPIVIGYLSCFYLGGSCTISIEEHPDYPLWVVDCQEPGQVFYYEAVGVGYVAGGSPVEDVSWGSIKSMYR